MTETATCTVTFATTGPCGKVAVYTEGEFAECEEHAAEHGSLATTKHLVTKTYGVPELGDEVLVHRYGRTYHATVTKVGKRGAVYATFTYMKGTTRTVRV